MVGVVAESHHSDEEEEETKRRNVFVHSEKEKLFELDHMLPPHQRPFVVLMRRESRLHKLN